MTFFRWLTALPLVITASAALADLPPGAIDIGCNRTLIDERPIASDVSKNGTGIAKLYDGDWWAKSPYTTRYVRTEAGTLAIDLGGSVASTSRKSQPGSLALLPGDKNFYIEFEARISDNDRDHWPALWLMPIEHNAKQSDRHPSDPEGFERFLEIDVDEGGFAEATHGVAISWSGIWPKYQRQISNDSDRNFSLDRTKNHTFGVGYNASNRTIQWWLDGKKQQFSNSRFIPTVAAKHNYYLIMSAQTHGLEKPYTLYISRILACNKQG